MREYATLLRLMDSALPSVGSTWVATRSIYTFLSIVFALGWGLLVYGFYVFLTYRTTPDIALLFTGVAIILSALVFGLMTYFIANIQKNKSTKSPATAMADDAADIAHALMNEMELPIKENPYMALVIALSTGLLLGKKYR